MNTLPKEKEYTIDDIYALPEGIRAELIDDRIYYMAPPTRSHQRICFSLSRKIADYIEKHNGNCEVYPAPFAVFLNDSDAKYVEPDISVICDTNKLDEKGCHGAPDWIVEVVSPSSVRIDYITKLFKYNSAGVKEYWIVDPSKEITMVYNFEKDTVEIYPFGTPVPVGIYEGFEIVV